MRCASSDIGRMDRSDRSAEPIPQADRSLRGCAVIVAPVIVVIRERSVLISISHRDVASLRERRQLAHSKRNSSRLKPSPTPVIGYPLSHLVRRMDAENG